MLRVHCASNDSVSLQYFSANGCFHYLRPPVWLVCVTLLSATIRCKVTVLFQPGGDLIHRRCRCYGLSFSVTDWFYWWFVLRRPICYSRVKRWHALQGRLCGVRYRCTSVKRRFAKLTVITVDDSHQPHQHHRPWGDGMVIPLILHEQRNIFYNPIAFIYTYNLSTLRTLIRSSRLAGGCPPILWFRVDIQKNSF